MTALKFHIAVGILVCVWFTIATAKGCRVPESSGSSYGGGVGRGYGGSWGGGK